MPLWDWRLPIENFHQRKKRPHSLHSTKQFFFFNQFFIFTCRWCFLILEIRSPYKILVIGAVVRLYRQVGSSIIRLRINVVALNLLQGQEKTPTDFLFCFHFLPWARIMHAAERRRHVESERYLRIVMEAAADTTFSIMRLPFRSCTFFFYIACYVTIIYPC